MDMWRYSLPTGEDFRVSQGPRRGFRPSFDVDSVGAGEAVEAVRPSLTEGP